jgi:hypothetical protein
VRRKPKFPPLAIDLDDLKVTCECGGEMVGVGTVGCLDCDNTADEEDLLAFAHNAGAFVGCPIYVKRGAASSREEGTNGNV